MYAKEVKCDRQTERKKERDKKKEREKGPQCVLSLGHPILWPRKCRCIWSSV